MSDFPGFQSEEQEEEFQEFVEAAVEIVLRDEDPEAFLSWMIEEVPAEFPSIFPELPPQLLRAAMLQMGHTIWNATPLPSNNLRPRPLAKPGRNDPCLCGSGRKYKQCCQPLEKMGAEIAPEMMLPIVLGHLEPERIEALIAQRRLNAEQIALVAERALEDNAPDWAAELLEPLFAGDLRKLTPRHDLALDRLCDAYDALGQDHIKERLLARVAREAPREMRSEALQRLATIHMDAGNNDAAWETFRDAQRADPNSPNVMLLEVTLLTAQRRLDEARERARFSIARLRRMRDPEEYESAIHFLQAVVDDPEQAFASSGLFADEEDEGGFDWEELGDEGEEWDEIDAQIDQRILELGEWLDEQRERAEETELMPEYRVEPRTAEDRDYTSEMRSAFERMGAEADETQIKSAVMALSQVMDKRQAEIDPEGDEPRLIGELTPPESLKALESEWRGLFPGGKPDGVAMLPALNTFDSWQDDCFQRWMGFLRDHPEAFDSLEILDDLANLLALPPPWADADDGDEAFRLGARDDCISRAWDILNETLEPLGPEVRLPWDIPGNRNLHRLILRYAYTAREEEGWDAVEVAAEMLVRLDPVNNPRAYTLLSESYLRQEMYDEVLELSRRPVVVERPELVYDRALTLYRLGLPEESAEAMREAIAAMPDAAQLLIGGRDPDDDPAATEFIAQDYFEERGDLWREARGLVALLKKIAGPAAPNPRKPVRRPRRR